MYTDIPYLDPIIGKGCKRKPSKELLIRSHIARMINTAESMFRISGLPETIPEEIAKRMLICNGYAIADAGYNGNPYLYHASLGGELDEYYRQTIAIISNPHQRYNASRRIGKDCVLLKFDSTMQGLLPTFSQYAHLIAENYTTMRTAIINLRHLFVMTAKTNPERESCERYLASITDGEQAIIGESPIIGGISVNPLSTVGGQTIMQTIESWQYLKASELSEIGLNANFNMKREALNSAESALNEEALNPIVDNFKTTISESFDRFNQFFGASVRVDFASSWADRRQKEGESVAGDQISDIENPA